MRTLFILLVVLIGSFMGFCQEQNHNYSLDEAIEYGLKNNYKAINAERDIADAKKQKWETIASGLPQINGSVSYQNQIEQPVSLLPAAAFDNTQSTIDIVNDYFDANQTNFDVNAPEGFIPLRFGTKQSVNAAATLSQQIFDGSYIVGVQATKAFLSYSANNKEKTDLEVRKSIVEAYGNVLLAQESVSILERNKTTLEKTLLETTKIYENGLGDEESVEQLQITLSSIENQLKNAIRLKGITLQMLNLVMGLPIENPTTLKDNLDMLTANNIDIGLTDAGFDLEKNVDYKIAINLNEQRYFEWKLAKSRALPTLNAFINYGTSGFNDKFKFLNSEQQWFTSSILGVDLNIPIFSSFRRSASTQRAKIALEKAKTQLFEAEQQIRLQLENAKSNYILAVEQYQTSKDNLNLAERIEKKNQIKYFEGLATSFELRQAQTQLYDSQQTFLQSMVEVINKKTELETILNN